MAAVQQLRWRTAGIRAVGESLRVQAEREKPHHTGVPGSGSGRRLRVIFVGREETVSQKGSLKS